MRSVRLTLDETTFERLQTERELLGFADRASYLQWIVDHRAAIDGGTDRDQLLSAYAERLEELEERFGVQTGGFRGDFSPERVERVTDERLSADAHELQDVAVHRLDELSRRAVVRTREQLGRTPGTGLAYRSQNVLASEDTPGSDVADLDAIDVPGYDDDVVAARRRAVGAALAYLRDRSEAQRSDFVADLYPEYPAGYDSETGWWRCIKRGLRQVPAIDGGRGARVWSYAPAVDPRRGVTVTRISNE